MPGNRQQASPNPPPSTKHLAVEHGEDEPKELLAQLLEVKLRAQVYVRKHRQARSRARLLASNTQYLLASGSRQGLPT